MEHLVRFTSAEGRDAYHTAANLDEALKFVERLRNSEAVEQVRVFRLQEIPIEFRAYYKVEVRAGDETADVEPGEEPAPIPTVPSVDEAGDAAAAGADNGSGRRLFGRPA